MDQGQTPMRKVFVHLWKMYTLYHTRIMAWRDFRNWPIICFYTWARQVSHGIGVRLVPVPISGRSREWCTWTLSCFLTSRRRWCEVWDAGIWGGNENGLGHYFFGQCTPKQHSMQSAKWWLFVLVNWQSCPAQYWHTPLQGHNTDDSARTGLHPDTLVQGPAAPHQVKAGPEQPKNWYLTGSVAAVALPPHARKQSDLS